jgi:hypothetical protein
LGIEGILDGICVTIDRVVSYNKRHSVSGSLSLVVGHDLLLVPIVLESLLGFGNALLNDDILIGKRGQERMRKSLFSWYSSIGISF